jgi:hypothetical protein
VEHHPLPSQALWDRFCDAVGVASQMLARQVPSPLPGLTPAQYACGKFFAATQELLAGLAAPREVRDLAGMPARAWQHAGWGIPDPLFTPASIGRGRRSADVRLTVFRCWIVKLTEEQATGAASLRAAAQAVSRALKQAQAPKDCTPAPSTIRRWQDAATDPKTPTDRHLADAYAFYRPRDWPSAAGSGLAARVRWIITALPAVGRAEG